jgi:hypothetical protein
MFHARPKVSEKYIAPCNPAFYPPAAVIPKYVFTVCTGMLILEAI